jgi:2'-5' RNA ligase superfamily
MYDAEKVAQRVPAHITLLVPFVPADRVDEGALRTARSHFAEILSFDAELAAVGRFEEHVWLSPAPRECFVELISATWERFPEYPPYGGDFAGHDPVPHLTVGGSTATTTIDELVAAAERELAPHLPLAFHVDAASLLVEQSDHSWRATERFRFAR